MQNEQNQQEYQILKYHTAFGGEVRFISHFSKELGLEAKIGLYLPSSILKGGKIPALYCLAGLTCNEETFLIKSNAVRFAEYYGIALIAPDTSPRGAGIAGEDESYDLGTGAGYYVDATAEPWSLNYRMASYVGKELPHFIEENFSIDGERCGIMGHSMGGMGALSFALRDPQKWKSVSAFAPIASPSQVEWGQKVSFRYFGSQVEEWEHYDPTLLFSMGKFHPSEILIDQGMEDQFLSTHLRPDLLEYATHGGRQKLKLRRHENYDHSYWFVQSFIEDHLKHHAAILTR